MSYIVVAIVYLLIGTAIGYILGRSNLSDRKEDNPWWYHDREDD